MVDIIKGRQCVTCGRIDVPHACIGICEDQRIELVSAAAYREAAERAERAERECRRLRALLGQPAATEPDTAGARSEDLFQYPVPGPSSGPRP